MVISSQKCLQDLSVCIAVISLLYDLILFSIKIIGQKNNMNKIQKNLQSCAQRKSKDNTAKVKEHKKTGH